jgi:hypothetical protein
MVFEPSVKKVSTVVSPQKIRVKAEVSISPSFALNMLDFEARSS